LKVLFDQGTPAPLRNALANHEVSTAYEPGWATLKNGELLAAAEEFKFEVFITTDKNLRYQQNLVSRSISIIVLSSTSWSRISKVSDKIVAVVEAASKNSYIDFKVP